MEDKKDKMQQAAVLMAYHPLKDSGTLIREVTNKNIHLHNNLEPAAGTADELCLLLLSFKKSRKKKNHTT